MEDAKSALKPTGDNNIKSQLQKEALDAWKETFKGTIVLFTGAGKTKLGVDAILETDAKSVLIVTLNTRLRDNEWPDEIKKWGGDKISTVSIDIECINTS